ncbi:arginine--tRNA ligase [Verrucomicrobium sp. BvORR106]|uniref:arginine--tRNA ligase n=1 Tax=Verrucomicrobium sp. BvORR106 TaxID=1403819 RepID=UPI0005717545|nr:arginine--tRNA ligase [Verrucomicrobium sp. BvORR106]
MRTYRQLLTERLLAAFTTAGITPPEGLVIEVTNASDSRFGDYQSNAAMTAAKLLSTKELKVNPRAMATQLVEAMDVTGLCEKPEIAGPGFLNFRLTKEALQGSLSSLITDERLGVPTVDSAKTIVVDFSAPNVAKPMHVGHIRSTFIGDSLARLARLVGHNVITDNHVGDWGTQFGMIIHGWKTRLNHDALKQDPIHELVRVYREINAATKADETVLETCKTELVKLQQGDDENLAIWKECVKLTLDQLHDIYGRLGIQFDHYLGESYYNDALAPLVEDMLAKGQARISEGAACVFSDGVKKPEEDPFLINRDGQWTPAPCIVRKSDGGFLYATTDLATIDHRVIEWKADEIWYVVGAPQQLHFRQVFEAAHRRGHSTRMVHIAFGSILGPDGKMFKTRSGESVGLLDVIDEAVERARAVVEEREFSDEEKAKIASVIGIAAVKYAELSQHRMTDYKFAWEKMLSFQGNTAPYLLNAYVRTRAIFRKLDGEVKLESEVSFTEDAERQLALKLAQFGEAVHDVLDDFRPNLLAQYLYELAGFYHTFYEACPVLRSEGVVRNTRLVLADTTSRVLKSGLGLLGIETTDRM